MNQKQPQKNLDVDDIIGIYSRIGTYRQGTLNANGEWQPILTGLESCNIFEFIAHVITMAGNGGDELDCVG